ncbi:beta-1,3-galactosyl-O-glycosyl-glycoprotein beta-1,6-N-acetylglucosaminyltransferase 3-like [Carcharodon carcharias]|uniref:beta-1,3-galactosyl-O-glycosyl-glycoprotein beta-1,6-N-acetylglucosaminyltransferase 3-like n=1 Tax=Carcharodon carcharias TaxID=13397 RepID=UPI001B7EDFA6|nr:beta-1,3-galactosyl-O-glycosyl-glycoprotein beta-1,6-N-acetylglucosaminyltransferase 3-like [Carcharodon carcharias]XP_041029783.1 beta-1,3-galactosyl-O-glycosyl-glycoprotein beta-1,6-N-acetylglucosaminyltransferase 3-like [Carcharodon carcharias]
MLNRKYILSGLVVIFLCGSFYWRGNTLINYWKPIKQKSGYNVRYEHLDLAGKNSTCWKIISGDTEAIEEAVLTSITVESKHKVVTEIDYLAMTQDCCHFIKNRKYITFPLSTTEQNFPLAYSMVIHTNIEMFERLLRSIYAPQNVYCVHVDRKSSKPFYSAVHAIASCFNNVFIVGKLESVTYGSWSRVQADLNCMEELLQSPVPWRYLINVCGQDFPTKTNWEIVNSLIAKNSSNVMDSVPPPKFKKRRWEFHYDTHKGVVRTHRTKSPPPIHSPMFVGGAYVLVTREFVRALFVNPETQAFFKWSEDTYSPDEHIWATLQRMPEIPGSIPYTPGLYKSDPVVTRAVKWSFEAGDVAKGAPYPPCTGRYRHQICIYGSGDLNWIVQQDPLFANKFDPRVDNTAVRCLEEYLRYKAIN